MAKRLQCPAGHSLQAGCPGAGICDGCRGKVQDGEQVMDCRRCNFYLCKSCQENPPTSLWSTISALISDVTCHAPDQAQLSSSELLLETQPPKRSPQAASRDGAPGWQAGRGAGGGAQATEASAAPPESPPVSVNLLGLPDAEPPQGAQGPGTKGRALGTAQQQQRRVGGA